MNIAMVTGAASGLGQEIAGDLLRRGWQLLLPVRSAGRAEALVALAAALGAPRPVVVEVDLGEPGAVRMLCGQVARYGPLDLVVNNAAVGGGIDVSQREVVSTGTELRMAVNAVTPHLIARELAPHLGEHGRIVQVGSAGQMALDLTDLNNEQGYDGITAYCRSKLALIMSAMELAEAGVPVNVVHPAREMPTRIVADGGWPIASTLDDGTLAVLRVALDSALSGVKGVYFNRFDQADPHEQALDTQARRRVVSWLDQAAAL